MKKTIARPFLCLLLVASMLSSTVLTASAAWWDWFGGSSSSSSWTYTVEVVENEPDSGAAEVAAAQGTVGSNKATVKDGDSAYFMSMPRPYYKLDGWYDENGALLSDVLGFTLDNIKANRTITAKFENIAKYDCYHEHDESWQAWSNSSALPDVAGNYYLTTDVTLNTSWVAPDGVALCLNGYVLSKPTIAGAGEDMSTITVKSYTQVVITDCTTGLPGFPPKYFDVNGIGQWIPSENNRETPFSVIGGVITGRERGIYIEDKGSLHMFGGHVVGICGDYDGPGVSVSNGGIFYMYDGSIRGNVNTYTGQGEGGIKDYDGGGGLFVDRGSRAYLVGYSTITDNTALYTDNGGGVYNYKGEVYLGECVYIDGNKGASGAASNYQSYGSNTDSVLHPLRYLPLYLDPDPEYSAYVGINNTGAFTDPLDDNYSWAFASDRVNYAIQNSSSNILSNTKRSISGYIVTAGTRGAGYAEVNGEDGATGVIVSKNSKATLEAIPENEDYIFVGWYDENGALITTNPTYTISKVNGNKNVQAYFMLDTEQLSVNGAGAYQIFNSGDSKSFNSSSYRYKNPAFSTLTNENKFLYFHNEGSETYYDEEGPVGLPFTIDGKVLEKSVVTMNCYDVDEDSGERDVIYLLDLTNHTKVELGYLTGRNEEWNTTSFTVTPDMLQEGHTYQLYLENKVRGWVAWIDTASISIGAMEAEVVKAEPVTAASISGSIDASRNVSGTLNVDFATEGTYNIEYKATHIETNQQLGSLFVNNQSETVDTTNTFSYSFTLESGAPEGAYRIDAYILDASGNVLKTVSCTAGYAKSAVTYNANGGTNNVPEDTNAYNSGDNVTVKFDYTPTKRIMAGAKARSTVDANTAVFTGWSTNPNATEPMYTQDGTKTFNIGSEDVTLYAIYHTHTAGEMQTENTVAPTCTTDGSHDEVIYCTDPDCGGELSRVTVVDKATGHTMGEWVIDVDATDDTEGSKHRDCEVCGYRETETIPAKGHTYTSEVVAPTCTEQGYTEHTCTNENCGDSYRTDYTDALGHQEEILPAVPATCTETGLTEGKECTVCGVTTVPQEIVDALGHNYVVTDAASATCTLDGYITKTCTNCGDTYTEDNGLAAGHTYTPEVTAPTCTESGYTKYTCTNDLDKDNILCGHSYMDEYIEPLGHEAGEWITVDETTGKQEQRCINVINENVCDELLATRYISDTNFTTTFDSGYYAEKRTNDDSEKTSGIIAFNTQYTGTLPTSEITKFGIFMFKNASAVLDAANANQTSGGKAEKSLLTVSG